jgi:hypothetical protein
LALVSSSLCSFQGSGRLSTDCCVARHARGH